MDFPWGLLVFLVGIAYGYFAPGRQDKSTIFKKALLWGAVIGIVLVLIAWLTRTEPLGVGLLTAGFIGFIISVVILTLFFIVGVWIGDWVEHRRHPGGRIAGTR